MFAQFIEGFGFGNASILTTACLLPLYPGLIAFLAGTAENERTRRATAWLGVLVLAGVLTMMTLIGLVLSLLSTSADSVLPVVLPLIYGLVIVFGVMMFVGRNPFARIQTIQAPVFRNPYLTAYVYGLLFGPMAFPCIGPFLISTFVLGATDSALLGQNLIYFIGFGLGFGWPLMVLPLLALPLQRRLVSLMGRHHTLMERSAGILLIAAGVFGILSELGPKYVAGWPLEFTQTENLIYWGGVALVVVAVGLVTLRRAQHIAQSAA